MHWRQTSKDIFPQRWNNKGLKKNGDYAYQCVWANENNIFWWSMILCCIHWWLFENTCLSFESQGISVWQIQKIQGVGRKWNKHEDQDLAIQTMEENLCPKNLMCFWVNVKSNNNCAILSTIKWSYKKCWWDNYGMCQKHYFCIRLDFKFWAKIINTIVYMKNQCPTKALDFKTPKKHGLIENMMCIIWKFLVAKPMHTFPMKILKNQNQNPYLVCVLRYCERCKTYC
jgi:hypothetical protein